MPHNEELKEYDGYGRLIHYRNKNGDEWFKTYNDAEWIVHNKEEIANAISIGIRKYFGDYTSNNDIVDKLYEDGLITDKAYWNKIINGETQLSTKNLVSLMTKAHNMLNSK